MVTACLPFGQREEIMACVVCCNFVFILLLSQCSAFCQQVVCAVILQTAGFPALIEATHFSILLLWTVFFVNNTCHSLNPCFAVSSDVYMYAFPFIVHINLNIPITGLFSGILILLSERLKIELQRVGGHLRNNPKCPWALYT